MWRYATDHPEAFYIQIISVVLGRLTRIFTFGKQRELSLSLS
jgi:hypothetical protein